MKIIISESQNGITIKQLLLGVLRFSGRTLTYLKSIPDGITVDGVHQTVRYTLSSGEELCLKLEDAVSSPGVDPINEKIDIIFEDEYMLAVNKPAFLPVHPAKKNRFDSLAARTLSYLSQDGAAHVFRAINRLDRDTSGIVLVAKDRITACRLSEIMLKKGFEKEYVAVLKGDISKYSCEGSIDFNIRRPDISSMKREAVPKHESSGENSAYGACALTHFRLLSHTESYSTVSIKLGTGRTHQIRVHFSAIGFPVVSDKLYGTQNEVIDRQALHACALSFVHPFSGEKIRLACEFPEDMKKLIALTR